MVEPRKLSYLYALTFGIAEPHLYLQQLAGGVTEPRKLLFGLFLINKREYPLVPAGRMASRQCSSWSASARNDVFDEVRVTTSSLIQVTKVGVAYYP